jgi:hypothetical protein
MNGLDVYPVNDAAAAPYVFAPAPELGSSATEVLLWTGNNATVVVYVPFRIGRRRFRIEQIRHYLLTTPAGTGTRRIRYAFYRDVVWNAAVVGPTGGTQGRYVPRNVVYEEEFAIVSGGQFKGNLDQTLSQPLVLEAHPGRTGGDLFYMAYQIEHGFSAGSLRGHQTRSMIASAHTWSEIGAYPRPFADAPSGTYRQESQTVTVGGVDRTVDQLALASWLVGEDV